MAYFPTWSYRSINGVKRQNKIAMAEQPSVVLFTSGSEGTPKGVVLSHKNLQANRYQLSSCIDFTEQDKVFIALPIFHSFGLTGGMLLPILSGAEKLRIETLTTWTHKFGVRIFDGYGATESSPVLATNTPMQYRTGTVGRLLPGIQYTIKPVTGIEVGGILNVYGPNVMKGYLLADNPGVIAAMADGWYDTGDIVSIDEQGFVTIQGRVKRFAKIAGEMVSLSMVESFINALWPDFQHAVVNMPDSKKGEQLVLMTTHKAANREDLVKYAKSEQISELSIPRKIVIVDKLPLLGSGKVDYTRIKTELSEA